MGASEVVDDASHCGSWIGGGAFARRAAWPKPLRQFITNALEHGHNGLLPAAEAERALLASDVKKTMEAYRSGAVGGQPQTSAFLDGMLTDINGQVAEASPVTTGTRDGADTTCAAFGRARASAGQQLQGRERARIRRQPLWKHERSRGRRLQLAARSGAVKTDAP